MSFTYRHRKALMLVFFIILSFSLSFIYLYSNKKIFVKKKKEVKVAKKNVMISKKKEEDEDNTDLKKEVKVDVKGEVNSPGLYTMSDGMRVSDAINAAGGLTMNASTEVINLSKKLKDEMVIIVYSKDEVANFVKTKEEENIEIDKCAEGNLGVANDACINKTEEENAGANTALVNVNTATKEELMTVSGIGEAKADAIIKYREEHTKFNSLDELKEISGIGDNIYAKIKDHLTI